MPNIKYGSKIHEGIENISVPLADGSGDAVFSFGGSSGGDAKVTEYIVTEDSDRSLWLNEQQIKLVRGLNIISLGWIENTEPVNNRSGLTTLIVIFWGGNPGTINLTSSFNSCVRGLYTCTNGYNLASGYNHLITGNTKSITVAEDGLLSFTTSATEVTLGNYNNSFMGAGNTYYLYQFPYEEVC